MAEQETNAVWICDSCVHGPPSSFDGKPCTMCNPNDQMLNFYQKREQPIATNADRIRARSDEELAGWLCSQIPVCANCPGMHDCYEGHKGLLDWLQSPAGGGTE